MVVEEVGEEAGIVDVVGGEAEAVVVIVDVEVMMLAYSCSGVKVHTMSLLSQFTGDVGPTVPISARIVDVFRLFFTTTLVNLIVEQTNLYASQVMDPLQYDKWTKVTEDEIPGVFWVYDIDGYKPTPSPG